MRVFREISEISLNRPVATIGIFDGVHLAHQAIINSLKDTANKLSGESVVVTFWPHPRAILKQNNEAINLINTLEERIERLEETGIDNLIVIPFNKEFASITFREFVTDLLVRKLAILHLVVGYNHHFGKNREGNFENLRALAQEFGFGLSQQDPVSLHNTRVSSSHIRSLIQNGKIEEANQNLGYAYTINGLVGRGQKIGQHIGFPTANLMLSNPEKLVPGKGVYAVMVELEGKIFQGMMNIGCRPTLDEDCQKILMEVNLFDFSGDIYNKELRVHFVRRVRDEKKFDNLQSLGQQISKDKEFIKNILALVKIENKKLVI
jgi:riboflavin kinase / FMN adenylyltransferase